MVQPGSDEQSASGPEKEEKVNKQEALVAVLQRMREWEERSAEVRKVPPEAVLEDMANGMATLELSEGAVEEDERRALLDLAAGALYLLVDEVTVVEGRTLDEWLASEEDHRLAMFARGKMEVVVTTAPEVGVNPALAREAYQAGRRSR